MRKPHDTRTFATQPSPSRQKLLLIERGRERSGSCEREGVHMHDVCACVCVCLHRCIWCMWASCSWGNGWLPLPKWEQMRIGNLPYVNYKQWSHTFKNIYYTMLQFRAAPIQHMCANEWILGVCDLIMAAIFNGGSQVFLRNFFQILVICAGCRLQFASSMRPFDRTHWNASITPKLNRILKYEKGLAEQMLEYNLEIVDTWNFDDNGFENLKLKLVHGNMRMAVAGIIYSTELPLL